MLVYLNISLFTTFCNLLFQCIQIKTGKNKYGVIAYTLLLLLGISAIIETNNKEDDTDSWVYFIEIIESLVIIFFSSLFIYYYASK
jgi:hypothetical protein